MKRRRFFSIVLIFLFALIGLGLWWFLWPTATALEKTATAPTPARIDSVKLVAQSTQVELPKAPPVPAHTEAAADAAPSSTDPQSDLKTVIPDLARMAQAGDVVGPYETYTPPDKLDPKEIQQLENVQRTIDAPLSASEAARYPLHQLQMQQTRDSAARSWEALETQIPTYNATGDEATYLYSTPDNQAPVDTFPVTFVKINGRWYQKPTAATGSMSFVGPANTSTK